MLCFFRPGVLIEQNAKVSYFAICSTFTIRRSGEIRKIRMLIQNPEKGHFRTIGIRAHPSSCGCSVLSCSLSRCFVHFSPPLSRGAFEARSLLRIHFQSISSESAVTRALFIFVLMCPCPTRSISRAKVAARRFDVNGGLVISISELWNHLRYARPREVNNFTSAFRC